MLSIPLKPILMVSVISFGNLGFSQSSTRSGPEASPPKQGVLKQKSDTPKPLASASNKAKEAPKQTKDDDEVNDVGDTKLVEQSRTNIDFSESLIEGKMNAPSGFLIQGRLSQDLTRMVRLRTSFKPEILKSTSIPEKKP